MEIVLRLGRLKSNVGLNTDDIKITKFLVKGRFSITEDIQSFI